MADRLSGLKASIAERKARKKLNASLATSLPAEMSKASLKSTGGVPPPAKDLTGRVSPSQLLSSGQLNEQELLGPQGAFASPLKTSLSSVDLLRSSSYDTTSRLLSSTSAVTLQSFPAPGSTSHSASVERIGSCYTPSAIGLSMVAAKKVGDKINLSSPTKNSSKGRSRKKQAVVAPAAFEQMSAVNMGMGNQAYDDEEGSYDNQPFGRQPVALTSSRGKPFVPDLDSPTAVRTNVRVGRSPPRMPIVAPITAAPAYTLSQSQVNMDSWNPLAGQEPKNAPPPPQARPLSSIEKALQQEATVANYEAEVMKAVESGVRDATGTGVTAPLVQLNQESIDGIIERLAGAMVLPADVAGEEAIMRRNERLDQEFDQVSRDYTVAVARGVVDYLIKDPSMAASLNINLEHLRACPSWWTNGHYESHSFRVLRQTGVSMQRVQEAFVSVQERLCVCEDVMLDLEKLWVWQRMPGDWEGSHLMDVDPEADPDQAQLPPTYEQLNFTDVGQLSFRAKLPFTISSFHSHVERRANEVMEALRECWVGAAGGIVGAHIEMLREEVGDTALGVSLEPDPENPNEAGLAQPSVQSLQSQDSGEEYDKWYDETYNKSEGKDLLDERFRSEGLNDDLSQGEDDILPRTSGEKFSRVRGIFDSASTLMSRQLRGSTENSLKTFSDFFLRFSDPDDSGDSAFSLRLKMNDKFHVLKKTDPEYDPEAPLPPIVIIEPSLEEIKDQACSCIDQIISAAQKFPRPDTHFTPASPMNFVPNSDALGPCTVTEEDEIVLLTKDIVCNAIDAHFAAPDELVAKFTDFHSLLSGEWEEKVLAAIEERKNTEETTVANLEKLFKVADELRSLIDLIKGATDDLNYFPMFMVNAYEVKTHLIKIVDRLRMKLLDTVAQDNREHMHKMGGEYQEIVNTLVTDPTDAAELKALQEYAVKSMDDLSRLLDEYLGEVYERVKFLLDQEFKVNREDLNLFYTTYSWPNQVKTFMAKSTDLQNNRKRDLELVVEGQQEHLSREIASLERKVEKLCEQGSTAPADVQNIYKKIQNIKENLDEAEAEAESIGEKEVLLEIPSTDNESEIKRIRAALGPLDRMWSTTKEYTEAYYRWRESPLASINPEEADRQADDLFRSMSKIVKELGRAGESRGTTKRAAMNVQNEIKTFLEEQVPLMLLICNPGLRQRHWQQIEQLTLLTLPVSEMCNLAQMADLGLHHHVAQIEDCCIAASKENTLEQGMDKMEMEWNGNPEDPENSPPMEFTLKPHRNTGTYILSSVDEIQQMLDDQIVKAQAMSSSRYVKPFKERITIWEKTLNDLQEILDNWLQMQATWLYLEPIFSSEDIMRQMPVEGKLFKAVDAVWREAMQNTFDAPGVIVTARREGLLDSLINANGKLDTIQKGLADYLETKMVAFPRFFFLSADELLEILAETKEPRKVQPHMKKCFDGIDKLEFQDGSDSSFQELDITACLDAKGERIPFEYEACNHKLINPKDSGGNVEQWLVEVEIIMKKSLAYTIDNSYDDFQKKNFMDWIKLWQGQVILAVNQIMWTARIEASINEGQIIGAEKAITNLANEIAEEVLATVKLVRTKISKALRTACGALVVLHVHNRDTTFMLAKVGVESTTDFDLLAQLRYYTQQDGESAQSGLPGTIDCCMINAHILYAYEYLGNNGRLVITPLTDRCYRTLMGAIHLNLGGAPEGPAGTGKTETTKDLGKAIAIQCVVTNCSDGLDWKAMEKFFKGLASAGAWACFDEFNRITLEVLSVVAQQILQIQIAKARLFADDLPGQMFIFGGSELKLRPTCCPFITMNPGYAGRAELPDNLKVLFRTVAMMVPDYAMIGEIILYSMGYENAKPLAAKIVTTYKLCSEQLSNQSHYDYGMRAVISVLRAAGNLKQTTVDLSEDILVLRSIIDVNLPKFLSPDVPLFDGITGDLFPGVIIPPPDRASFRAAFEDSCRESNIQPVKYFYDKIVQIYDMMVVRHGFMIVGMPFSGKTSAWRTLADMMGKLHAREPEDSRWTDVVPFLMNPKSVSMTQLYGSFDPVSHEWSDGILPIQYRNAATSKVGKPEDRKWVLFDGPVDAIWIENMNTVLDDNKKLCLMSGEIIAMSDVMSMMFEPMDLLVASPATVSRCGMIYLEPERLGWQPLLDSWVNKWSCDSAETAEAMKETAAEEHAHGFVLVKQEGQLIQELFAWIVEPLISFVRKETVEVVPTVDTNLALTCMNSMECMLSICFSFDFPEVEDAKVMRRRQQDIECCFMQSIMWSIGGSCNPTGQKNFDAFFKEILEDKEMECLQNHVGVSNLLGVRGWSVPKFDEEPEEPEEGQEPKPKRVFKGDLLMPMPLPKTFYEYVYVDGKWKTWEDTLDKFVIPDDAVFADIVVSNKYTAQFSYFCDLLLKRGKKALFCGPTGTGKSTYVLNAITKEFDQNEYRPIILGFSAKTSANMTQDIIHGKLDKRRKGMFGPPKGQVAIVFVDDLNMPEVETYGAQPPIELLRQMIDNGGYYDLVDPARPWLTVVDTTVCAAMGPPGGGRNGVTPRLLRHFSLMCFDEFDDSTLVRIFNTIGEWYFTTKGFSQDIIGATKGLVNATLEGYRASMASLLPTPAKSHYVFNLRDFSRVLQGVLMVKKEDSHGEPFTKANFVRLWMHEMMRVFCDRLINEQDRIWFLEHCEQMVTKHFNAKIKEFFSHLDTNHNNELDLSDLRNLFFGEYMSPEDMENKPYEEIQDLTVLTARIDYFLEEYNAQSKAPMPLVMFQFAIEHVSRISRVLKMDGGNALMVGVGGSGRQSVGKLATFMAFQIEPKQIEISKNYTDVEWREDLKKVLIQAGNGDKPMVFLFSDSQIKNESYVEDINNILNSGEVPNLFPNDEKMAIIENARRHAKVVYGKAAADMTNAEMFSFFIKRVKKRLHVLLAFSPIGDAFRERLRLFPSLINCCAIDWFTAWPTDALVAVADRFISEVKFDADPTKQKEIVGKVVDICQEFHTSARDLSAEFLASLRRHNYVTPTSYLELIYAFKGQLDICRNEVSLKIKRYSNGLEKLAFAEESVEGMQQELTDLQPILITKGEAVVELMAKVEAMLPGVREKQKVVGAEAAVAQVEADKVQVEKDSVQADLAEAIPALNDAIKALDTIKPADINELKGLKKPPATVKLVCEAVCIFLEIKPQRIPDPEDTSKRIQDYWGPSQTMLGEKTFIQSLKTYDKDNISPKIISSINKTYMTNEMFTPANAKKASNAAAGLCKWCHAMVTYDRVAKVVGPKREALKKAEEELEITMGGLREKQAALKEVEDNLAKLEGQLEGAKTEKQELADQVDLCGKKLVRAEQLISGLGGEKSRWGQFKIDLSEQYVNLTGDVLISAGIMSYLGPFTSLYREKQVSKWVASCLEKGIPASAKPSLAATLGDPVKVRQWNIDGLPTDAFSIDNGIVVQNARRWPLMIDPQGQANKWIRNMEKENNLKVCKPSDPDFLRTLENSINFGSPVLMENVQEDLDPSLEPLLLKQLFKKGGVMCIKLGDTEVEYSDQFRFYLTTKLPNPHYLPEVAVKVSLLNFMITPEGLTDQLLGIVVSQERPDLEEQKEKLILEGAENKRKLKEIEDEILHILSSSEGNILEDASAIDALKQSKIIGDDIKEKQAVAEATELDIDEVRSGYKPVAYSTQVLFFCITTLANIEPVYQYSLQWFIQLFISSIKRSEKSKDITQRMKNLDEHYTYSLYLNICRSLLEKDKIVFSFLLTVRIMQGKGEVDDATWLFLLTGGVAMDNHNVNPCSDWLSEKSWGEICRASETVEAFAGFKESFSTLGSEWKKIYDSTAPHEEKFAGEWEDKLSGMSRLIVLRCIRSDKLILGIQQFIISSSGEKYMKPPTFDLELSYNDSSPTTPLVFILSPGSDPMTPLLKLAKEMGIETGYISLGQGQGPGAEKMIIESQKEGKWAVMQNCMLAPSWMNSLEKICEDFTPDNCHDKFRLWCTTYPTPDFPVSILQNGVKMTNEPPKGLRANIAGSFSVDPIGDPVFFSSCTKGEQFRALVYNLCFFHAAIQERRTYGPLGWNIPYEFNMSDLAICARQLVQFLDDNEQVPWKALKYTAGECNYGGRVTDDKDRRCLNSILDRFYNDEAMKPGGLLDTEGLYTCPPDTTLDGYKEFIDNLPLVTGPAVVGLHDNANITKNQFETDKVLGAVLITEAGGSGGGGGGAAGKDAMIESIAGDIIAKLPANFDMEAAMLKYPVSRDESMNTVLHQELYKFNLLLDLAKTSLTNLKKAVQGLVVMSSELEGLGSNLFYGLIPNLWKKKSFASLKPLGSYIADFHERLTFFGGWLNSTVPIVFWISGFFFPPAFLTGAKQNYARKKNIAIDLIDFEFELMPKDTYTRKPEDGVYTIGFFFEGARWDKDKMTLSESLPKQLFSPAPIIFFLPLLIKDMGSYPHYNCPVYKTSDRRGILATTGHSTNFILFVRVPSEVPESHWVGRGCAMISQLDD
ncbi:hypothetical protein TrVE_jg2421 [Triparma verrucosa]|uniref:EF-hand domain-containing protein n=1 Tax=Triparma verrucosa TaxID=1606542 RepID=A0A9W7F846_9STRA|nr:hypothetical protein TrVE_jg2421 [Triparma verrucosa]